jgi:hypothetical protein
MRIRLDDKIGRKVSADVWHRPGLVNRPRSEFQDLGYLYKYWARKQFDSEIQLLLSQIGDLCPVV